MENTNKNCFIDVNTVDSDNNKITVRINLAHIVYVEINPCESHLSVIHLTTDEMLLTPDPIEEILPNY